ncbi:MAG: DUF305 domain-containing protein [Candidatus Eremiobacteraeota bacterium]|nr:DUF305 domain-containing protein [Candidatus Eremiobacteraeota bacterium]NNM92022.1 DUF305 domain-containing protein [Candidatus Eremiobacteraeota bacterium]
MMNTLSLQRVAFAAVLALGAIAVTPPQTSRELAQSAPAATTMPMSGMQMGSGMMGSAKMPAERAMLDAMKSGMGNSAKMGGPGAMAWSGNPDLDYVTIALHHANVTLAIAKVELTYGKDPAARAIAESTIAEQTARIEKLKAIVARLHH